MNKKTNEYIERAHKMACNHGFHDEELGVEHCLMLVLTEISEMVEADRKGKHAQVAMYKRESVTPQPVHLKDAHKKFCFEAFIKDTFEDEMADACIRLYDTAGTFGVRFSDSQISADMGVEYGEYISSLSLPTKAFVLCGVILQVLEGEELDCVIGSSLCLLELMAEEMGIDLFWFIERKMEYNASRPNLNGKKY